MARLTVLIGTDVDAPNVGRIADAFPDVRVLHCPETDAFVAAAPQAEIIFTKSLPPGSVAAADKLRWVQAGTAGVNHLMSAGLVDLKVLLTTARGAHGEPISELILAMMLSFASGLHMLIRAQAEHARVAGQVNARKFELPGQTLCVLGLGDIGGTLAVKAGRLGMKVLGVRRSRRPFAWADEVHTVDNLAEVLPRCDHVALCLPLTPETDGIIGEPELRLMQPSAYIYNVGRGASIDAHALQVALTEGWIAGAGLDVTDPEPLPPDSPLWDMPNVILSQHTSGKSPYNSQRITDLFIDNLGRYLRREPLRNVYDRGRAY